MNEIPHDDRRVHPRTKTDVPTSLEHEGQKVDGVIENIGRGGVFFATEELELVVDDGAEVTLRFEADGKPCERLGTVLRTERYFDGTKVVRAFAIRFAEPYEVAG